MCGFRTEVSHGVRIGFIRGCSHLGLEHQVKFLGFSEEGAVLGVVVCDILFLGGGLSLKGEFFEGNGVVVQKLGVEFLGRFAGFVFILIRLVEQDGKFALH